VGEEGKGVTQGTTFLDVLKAILSSPWPWASVVVIFFLLLFRKPLVALIGRVRKFGRGAWNAEVEPVSQEQKTSTPIIRETLSHGGEGKGDPRAAADEIIRQIDRNQYVTAIEDDVLKALTNRGLGPGVPDAHRALVGVHPAE
jgi:hypothetical protein